jgi:hypothetical protein
MLRFSISSDGESWVLDSLLLFWGELPMEEESEDRSVDGDPDMDIFTGEVLFLLDSRLPGISRPFRLSRLRCMKSNRELISRESGDISMML